MNGSDERASRNDIGLVTLVERWRYATEGQPITDLAPAR